MTTYADLFTELQREEARLLLDKEIGASAIRLLIVQRSDGSVWEVEGWLEDSPASEAVQWSIPVCEMMLRQYQGIGLDREALYRWVEWRKSMDEVGAAVEAAEWLVSKR